MRRISRTVLGALVRGGRDDFEADAVITCGSGRAPTSRSRPRCNDEVTVVGNKGPAIVVIAFGRATADHSVTITLDDLARRRPAG